MNDEGRVLIVGADTGAALARAVISCLASRGSDPILINAFDRRSIFDVPAFDMFDRIPSIIDPIGEIHETRRMLRARQAMNQKMPKHRNSGPTSKRAKAKAARKANLRRIRA